MNMKWKSAVDVSELIGSDKCKCVSVGRRRVAPADPFRQSILNELRPTNVFGELRSTNIFGEQRSTKVFGEKRSNKEPTSIGRSVLQKYFPKLRTKQKVNCLKSLYQSKISLAKLKGCHSIAIPVKILYKSTHTKYAHNLPRGDVHVLCLSITRHNLLQKTECAIRFLVRYKTSGKEDYCSAYKTTRQKS